MPTGFRKTDPLITRILRLTVESGLLTAASSIASVTVFVGLRKTPQSNVYFVIPALAIAKLYSVTILAIFNNRPHPSPVSGSLKEYCDPIRGIHIDRTVVKEVWKDRASQLYNAMRMYSEYLDLSEGGIEQSDITKIELCNIGSESEN